MKNVKYEKVKELEQEQNADFVIKVYRGAVLPQGHPKYNANRIKIEIFSNDFIKMDKCLIQIDGKDYKIKSQNLFNSIKNFVSNNLDILIDWSKQQTKFNLDNNMYDGGICRKIKIKYGQLEIKINGQVRDIGNLCDEFIDKIKMLILDESEKNG